VNVLDIDLDFFLDRSVSHRDDDPENRPDDYGAVPWSVEETTRFVEQSLNVRCDSAGAVVQSHHEVFYEWNRRIEADDLATPFKLVHVDAHSDLGLGTISWPYLHSEFLDLKVDEMPIARQGVEGINFASFLAFALGCRWIAEVDFVINHAWHDDIPRYLLSNDSNALVEQKGAWGVLPYGDYSLEIELMQMPKWDPRTSTWEPMDVRRSVGEPVIPFNIITVENLGARYENTKWDYVFVSHSPGYVPSYADHLLHVVGNYIAKAS
jgi:uncharacterized protein UPF0489